MNQRIDNSSMFQQASAAELQVLLNAVPDLMFKVDKEGTFISYHAHRPEDLAMPPEVFLGKRINDIFPVDIAAQGMRCLKETLATKQVASHQYEINTQGGEVLEFEARYSAATDDEAIIFVRDVTARVKAEKNLARVEDRFVQCTNFAHIGVWDWTIPTNELYWSERIAPMFGYQAGELETSYENFLNAIHPDDRQAVSDAVDACVTHGKDYSVEHRVVWPNGDVRWVHETGYVVRDAQGSPQHMLGVVRDITAQKEAELRLRDSEARFKGIAESMSDWIWEVDAQGVYTFCSGRVANILGYSPEEILGRTPFDLMPPDEAEKIGKMFSLIVQAKAPIKNLENWNLAKDGQRVCLLTNGIPLLDDAGELLGYRGVDKDITRQKYEEAVLIEAKVEAETANQAKTEFLSRMSHELRTPMNAILGFTELLLEDKEEPLSQYQRDSLQTVRQAGHHLLDLINEVLDLSKIEAGKLTLTQQVIDWGEILEQCVELILPDADKYGVTLNNLANVQALSAGLSTWVQADPMRLKQVMLNLLSNAVKYNHRGGQVTLGLEPMVNGHLKLIVQDTGPGLSKEQLEQLFRPFHRIQTDNKQREGVGIGLVIAKRLMELMDGTVGVESTPGEGSSFWLEMVPASQ